MVAGTCHPSYSVHQNLEFQREPTNQTFLAYNNTHLSKVFPGREDIVNGSPERKIFSIQDFRFHFIELLNLITKGLFICTSLV